jgi:hypothetical protein
MSLLCLARRFTVATAAIVMLNAASTQAAPVVYYSFEAPDTADASVTDNSGNGRTGTLATTGTGGSFAYNTASPPAKAMSSLQYLTLNEVNTGAAKVSRFISTSELNFSTQSWTFAGWYRSPVNPAADDEFIFHLGSGDGFGNDNELYVEAITAGRFRMSHWLDVSGTNTNDVQVDSPVVDQSAWHHLAITFDSASPTLRLYVDGALAGSDSTFSLGMSQTSTNTTKFGGPVSNAARYANGDLDELAVFDSALSATEVASLANGTATPLTVPEPASAVFAGIIMAGLLGLRRRRPATGR